MWNVVNSWDDASLGYVYGKNFVTEPRRTERKPDRYPVVAAELVNFVQSESGGSRNDNFACCSRDLIAVAKRPEVREAFGKVAFEPRGATPEELSAFVKKQLEVWSRVGDEVGIKPE